MVPEMRRQVLISRLSSRTGWRLYTLVCFCLCVWWTFPSDLLLQRIVLSVARQSGAQVHYAGGDWTWWEGWVLRDLTVESPVPSLTTVQFSRLALRPSLFGLFRKSRLPFTFSADLYGGTLTGRVGQAAGGVDVQLALHQLALERWPFPPPWGQGKVAGKLTADGAFHGDPADLRSLQGTFSATLTNGAVPAGTVAQLPLLALQAVQVHLRATLTGKQLEIAACRLVADGVEAHVRGGILLRTPLARSGLDLQLTSKIMEGAPPSALIALMSFLPASSPTTKERDVSITGSPATPVIKRRE